MHVSQSLWAGCTRKARLQKKSNSSQWPAVESELHKAVGRGPGNGIFKAAWREIVFSVPHGVWQSVAVSQIFMFWGTWENKARRIVKVTEMVTGLWGTVSKCMSVCLIHSKTKQFKKNVGVWSRERFIERPYKEMTSGSCFKTPELPESFQQSPFLEKVREGCG